MFRWILPPTMVEIIPVRTARERKEFVRCAWPLHRDHPAWVPPLILDQERMLDPAKGEYFRHGNSGALFLARRDGQFVGRIGAFRNESHLRYNDDGAGFFGFFECVDDPAVAKALLAAAEEWLRAAGLRVVRGPANFNIQEEAGALIDGFKHAPMVGMNWTPPYFPRLFESAGYAKVKDLLVYRMDRTTMKPDRLDQVAAAAQRDTVVKVRTLDPREVARESRFFEAVFSEAWRANWGTVPISADEFREAYERYRFFLKPELVFLAEVDGEPAGVMLSMPDINAVLHKIDGRLFPTGFLHLLFGRRGLTRFRVFMLGVRPKFQRLGLPLTLLSRTRAELLRQGAQLAEFSWILEDNYQVRGLVERMGAVRVQTLRLFGKDLGPQANGSHSPGAAKS